MRKLVLFTFLCLLSLAGFSANLYFRGAVPGGSNSFNNAANWYLDQACTIPAGTVPGIADVAIFNNFAGGGTVTFNQPVDILAISIRSNAGAIVFQATTPINLRSTGISFELASSAQFNVSSDFITAGQFIQRNGTFNMGGTATNIHRIGGRMLVDGIPGSPNFRLLSANSLELNSHLVIDEPTTFTGEDNSVVLFRKSFTGNSVISIRNSPAVNTSLFNVVFDNGFTSNTVSTNAVSISGSTLTVRNNLTIQSGRITTSSSNIGGIRVGGNITTPGNLVGSSSAFLEFFGANNQTINFAGSDQDKWDGPVRMSKQAGSTATLNSPWLLDAPNQTLTFNSGNFVTTPTNVLIFGASAIAAGASNNSYVDGPVRKLGTAAFTFPVGDGGFYGPIRISGSNADFNSPISASAGVFQATYIRQNPLVPFPNNPPQPTSGGTPITISQCEYWFVDEITGIIPPNATATLIPYVWPSFENTRSCGVTDPSTLGLLGWLGSNRWLNFGSTGAIINSGGSTFLTPIARAFNAYELQPAFTLGTVRPDLNPLPVRWNSFTGRYFNGGVDLNWSTAAELNNDKFTVERSADGVNFTAIGEVKGRGNSSTNASYAFRDNKPLAGASYYRIRQTDFDGKESYSDVIKITITNGNAGGFRVFPNPLNGNVPLVLENTAWTNKKVTVTVFNALGAIVRQEQVTFGADSRARLDLTNLQRGSYFIRTQFNNQKEVLPFVIQ